jgi:hypothetical protein
MIEKPYILNGTIGRSISAASINVLQITGNAFISGERKPTNHDISAFLFAHFGEWKEVKKLAAQALSGGLDSWNEAVIDWTDSFFSTAGALATVDAGELVAQMLTDAFGSRVEVDREGGASMGKSETTPDGLSPSSSA